MAIDNGYILIVDILMAAAKMIKILMYCLATIKNPVKIGKNISNTQLAKLQTCLQNHNEKLGTILGILNIIS